MIALEAHVAEALLVGVVAGFMKVVHVQLAHERRKVVVLEVPRQDALGELIRLPHNEALPVLSPADYMIKRRVLYPREIIIFNIMMNPKDC